MFFVLRGSKQVVTLQTHTSLVLFLPLSIVHLLYAFFDGFELVILNFNYY